MVKKKVIHAKGKAIHKKEGNAQGIITEIEKAVNDIEVDMVKIFGTLTGTKDKIELVMDRGVFFEWVDALRNTKQIGRKGK